MALDWVDLLRRIEAAFPTALGGSTRDETLRSMLVPWANDLWRELETRKRMPLLWKEQSPLNTVQGTAIYTPDPAFRTIDRIWYMQASGVPKYLDRQDRHEALRRYGLASSGAPQGTPAAFSVITPATTDDALVQQFQIELFPTPDAGGPGAAGVYPLVILGSGVISDIIETAGTIGAASPTLTVTSGPYVTSRGAPTASTSAYVSVRGAGPIGPDGAGDALVTHWTAIAGNVVTLSTNSTTAVATAGQVFFFSTNWIIKLFPRLVYSAVLREVASRLKDQNALAIWQQRYTAELSTFDDFDADRLADIQTYATGAFGQKQMQGSPNDPVSPASAVVQW